jgi:pimeloyl-ACP methyl ester carboxylesterase
MRHALEEICMNASFFPPATPHRIGQGAPLVLLHDIGGSRLVWDALAPLADRFALLSYDLPGHGDAPPAPGACDIGDLSDQLAVTMTAAGIPRAHILGTGLGGMIAQHFAAAHPGRVDRLVLCDTSPALGEGSRDTLLTRHDTGPLHAAMARADLMDMAEEIFAPCLILCAEGAPLDLREGADFLARSILGARLAFVAEARADVVTERPAWLIQVLRDFLG